MHDGGEFLPASPRRGRVPGSTNLLSHDLKLAILEALEAAGGEGGAVGYLTKIAIEKPELFVSLLNKMLPVGCAVSLHDSDEEQAHSFTVMFADGSGRIASLEELKADMMAGQATQLRAADQREPELATDEPNKPSQLARLEAAYGD